ncbi:hypothetical protein AAVH_15911 [Aphelenchoides avenae]|nr:hypothetical protein AAVH_15911 [Aphelenchus avenae]
MWISIQFVYRYTFLCLHDKPYAARRVTWTVTAISFIWGIVGVYMIYKMNHADEGGTSQEQGIHAFELNGFDMSHKPVVVGSHIKHWVLKCWIAMWNVSCLTSIFLVAVLEVKIKRYVDNMGGVAHQSTRKMHKDFHRALLAMVRNE